MHLARLAAALAVVALALPSVAAPKAVDSYFDRWLAHPDKATLDAAWPAEARKQGQSGRSAMRCKVAPDGALGNCRLLTEWPVGQGFGKALLDLAPRYRHRPLEKGESDEVTVLQVWFTPFDTKPDWVRRPSPEDFVAVWPTGASTGGQGVVNCLVTPQGALTECVVLSERPEGRGFGGAALALTAQFGMKPATRNGRPVHSTATLPVNFTGNAPSGGRKVASATQAWAEAPSYADVVRAYPRRAAEARRAGRVTLGCRVTEAGRLVGCNAISQQPKGQGFADAAKDLAKTFRADLNEEERRLAGKFVVHLPFVFDPAMLSEGKPVVGRPKWVKLPSADDMRSAIGPLKLTGTARAQLECVVQPGGGVGDCKVVSEEPAGSGVGAAALTLAPKFRLTTWTSEGLPAIGGDVRIPLRFEP